MDSLSLTSDDETNRLIERAYATFREMTNDPKYTPRSYRAADTPIYRPDRRMYGHITSVSDAIGRIERVDSYDHRLAEPVTLPALKNIWEQYKGRYGLHVNEARNELPWDELLACKLSCLQWHDVFASVDKYVSRHEVIDPRTHQSSVRIPSELINTLALNVAGNGRRYRHQRREAILYLGKKGIDYDQLTEAKRSAYSAQAKAECWPRTYL